MEKHKFQLMQSSKGEKIYMCCVCECQKTVFTFPKVTFYMRNNISIGSEIPKCINIKKENLKSID
jgi:hypothetical protein